MQKITKKITNYAVKQQPAEQQPTVQKALVINYRRDSELSGITYKIKPPQDVPAMYVTINDRIDETGRKVPYEIFINCRHMEHFQWVAALTRIISAIFRKGGNINFIAGELQNIFDPKDGGYFKKGFGLCNGIVAEIGIVLQQHFDAIELFNSNLEK